MNWHIFNGITAVITWTRLNKIGVHGRKFRQHASSHRVHCQLWTNLNWQHKGNQTRPRTEWRGFRRGKHAALADARYDHSRSFMDEGAELCRMRFKCFLRVRCLQSLPSQHPIHQTHSTCFLRDDTKQKPPHPSRPRIPEAKKSPHLKHTHKKKKDILIKEMPKRRRSAQIIYMPWELKIPL